MRFSFCNIDITPAPGLSALAFALMFLFSGCKDSLDPLNYAAFGIYNYATVDARFCTTAPAPAHQKLKYLFIIDHSASNKPGVTAQAGDLQSTDPDGSRRYGPMVNFIKNLTVNANTIPYFDLIDFNDNASEPTGLSGFTSDRAGFLTVATTDWTGTGSAAAPSPNDGGFTNYANALSLAFTKIQADAQSEAATQGSAIVTSVYQIIFVSDGVPTISTMGGLSTQSFTTDLKPVIANIMALKTSATLGAYIANISLNTAYYFNATGTADANAINLYLQPMADAGNGLFEQFATGQQLLYQQFAPPSQNVVNTLADVFVENENGVWWDDGRFLLDSDGDGLPDEIERKFGSNPYVKDSDGNGVSDLVEYRTKGKPCNDAACRQNGRDLYAICAGYSPVTNSSNAITFASSANDGLNDCEKFLLNGSNQSFNGNGDLIPDFLAFKNTLSIQKADGAVALADPFGDGYSNNQKLKVGLPIQVSNKSIGAFENRRSNLTVESTPSAGVTCYHYLVSNIAMSAPANTMKVYVIQNSSLVQDKAFLMTAEKALGSNSTASFGAGDFH